MASNLSPTATKQNAIFASRHAGSLYRTRSKFQRCIAGSATRRGTLAVYNWRRLATLTTSSRLCSWGLEVKNETTEAGRANEVLPRHKAAASCISFGAGLRGDFVLLRCCSPVCALQCTRRSKQIKRLQLMSSVAVIALGLAVSSAALAVHGGGGFGGHGGGCQRKVDRRT
jgi:hypothetical protein